jgi:hypothetical protein
VTGRSRLIVLVVPSSTWPKRSRKVDKCTSQSLSLASYVSEGQIDSSLAVYARVLVNRTRPVGNGMIGWEGTFLNLERRTC